jgi:AcrR family transcriptional regulator
VPRVSEEHLESRRQQILEAARRCFVRNGFHETSMHDVFAESQLSAGAVYRYFSSKDELITAIASTGVSQLELAFETVLANEDPPPLDRVLELLLEQVRRLEAERQLCALAVQIWAEAGRNPTMRAWFDGTMARVQGLFARLIEIYQQRGLVEPGHRPQDAALVLGTLLPGILVQVALIGDVDPQAFANGVRLLGIPAGPLLS